MRSPGWPTLTHVNGLLLLIPLAIGLWDGPLATVAARDRRARVVARGGSVVIAPWAIRNAVTVHAFVADLR